MDGWGVDIDSFLGYIGGSLLNSLPLHLILSVDYLVKFHNIIWLKNNASYFNFAVTHRKLLLITTICLYHLLFFAIHGINLDLVMLHGVSVSTTFACVFGVLIQSIDIFVDLNILSLSTTFGEEFYIHIASKLLVFLNDRDTFKIIICELNALFLHRLRTTDIKHTTTAT